MSLSGPSSLDSSNLASSAEVRTNKRAGDEVKAQTPYATQVALRFGNAAGKLLDFRAGVRSGNLARECLDLLTKCGIRKSGEA